MENGRDNAFSSGSLSGIPMRAGGMPAGIEVGPKLCDALSYLRDIKNKFQDNEEVYNKFLEIMIAYKALRASLKELKQLFEGHRDLLSGFNNFIPKVVCTSLEFSCLWAKCQRRAEGYAEVQGYEIEMPEEPEELHCKDSRNLFMMMNHDAVVRALLATVLVTVTRTGFESAKYLC
eukprot:jgi/Botrbrau1/3948/Bobra.0365s0023.1